MLLKWKLLGAVISMVRETNSRESILLSYFLMLTLEQPVENQETANEKSTLELLKGKTLEELESIGRCRMIIM